MLAFDLPQAEAETTLEEDDADGERDGRGQCVSEQRIGVDQTESGSGQQPNGHEQQNRWQAQPGREPRCTDGGDDQHRNLYGRIFHRSLEVC